MQEQQFSLQDFLNRTIESNYDYLKRPESKASLVSLLTPILAVCFQDHSAQRTKQLEATLQALDSLVVKESPLVSWVYYLLSDAYKQEERLPSAIQFAQNSLKIREELYGPEANEICICLDHLSSLFLDSRDYQQATKLFVQSSDIKWKKGYTAASKLSQQCADFSVVLKGVKEFSHALDVLQHAKTYISAATISAASKAAHAEEGAAKGSDLLQQRHERDAIRLRVLFEMGSIFESQTQLDKLCQVYEEILEIYTCDRGIDTIKDVITTYDYLLSTYFSLDKYKTVRQKLGQLIAYVSSVTGHTSADTAHALKVGARILCDMSNTNSPTRLCDYADALRYYVAVLRIASTYSVTEQQARLAPVMSLKDIRETTQLLLYNSKPMRKEESVALLDKILGTWNVDFLLDSSKSQNQFLKIVYPTFMAEDSLREKLESIPSKSGSLAKYGIIKAWKTRYFTVERDTLYYYDALNEPKPQGEYNLLDVKTIEILAPDKKYKPYTYCFMLVIPKRNIVLAADTAEAMMDWVGVLTKAKNYWEEWAVGALSV